jgi:hypothetical protein
MILYWGLLLGPMGTFFVDNAVMVYNIFYFIHYYYFY